MGSQLLHQLAALTLDNGPRVKGLSPRARLVLTGMCLVAMDAGTKDVDGATYFGGWPYLARQWLGFEDTGPAAERAVVRAITELRTRGLVEPVARRGGPRGKRVYRLTLM